MNLYPTGTCFDDAIDYLNALASSKPWYIEKYNAQYRIVHGILLMDDNSPYSHCWLEKGEHCIDFRVLDGEKIMVQYMKPEFFHKMRVQRSIAYTIKQCCDLEFRIYGYPGPWDSEMRQLTKMKDRENENTKEEKTSPLN